MSSDPASPKLTIVGFGAVAYTTATPVTVASQSTWIGGGFQSMVTRHRAVMKATAPTRITEMLPRTPPRAVQLMVTDPPGGGMVPPVAHVPSMPMTPSATVSVPTESPVKSHAAPNGAPVTAPTQFDVTL